MENLKIYELVEELSKREGVEKIVIAPYEKEKIELEGPIVVLKIID